MGLPRELVSDSDNRINYKFFNVLCKLVGVDQHIAIAYRPRGNGRAEAAVKAIVRMLRTSLEEKPGNWIDRLPWAVWYLNSLPGVVLPYSPHQLVFGREPPFLGDLPPLQLVSDKTTESSERWYDKLDIMRKEVQQCITDKHRVLRDKHLSKHKADVFRKGDLVWVRNTKSRFGAVELDR